MARDLKGSHCFTCTPKRSSAIGMSHTCLALPAIAGTHLPTAEGWKAELAWVAGFLVRHSPIPELTGLNVAQLC